MWSKHDIGETTEILNLDRYIKKKNYFYVQDRDYFCSRNKIEIKWTKKTKQQLHKNELIW